MFLNIEVNWWMAILLFGYGYWATSVFISAWIKGKLCLNNNLLNHVKIIDDLSPELAIFVATNFILGIVFFQISISAEYQFSVFLGLTFLLMVVWHIIGYFLDFLVKKINSKKRIPA